MDYFIYPDSLILAMYRLPYCVNTDTLEISFKNKFQHFTLDSFPNSTLKHTTSLPLVQLNLEY